MTKTRLALEKYRYHIPRVKPRDLLVVAFTPHFFERGYVADFPLPEEWGMDINIFFTSDRSLIPEADALWFHGPSITQLPRKDPTQKWILMSMENGERYPALNDLKVLSMFDLQMTYRLDADIPCLYPNWHDYQGFTDFPQSTFSYAELAPAVYIASNPLAERDDFVAELMETFPVDCLGRCLNNRDITELTRDKEGSHRSRFQEVRHILGQYKFQIAIENSTTTDYITEKLFLPLSVGCVPVYRGAPNVRDFLPSAPSIVSIQDFDSPKSLGQHLYALTRDTEAYAQKLRWREGKPTARFVDLVNLGSVSPKYRMALKLLHGCGPECRCGGRIR